MSLLKMYSELIIIPLQEEVKRARLKVYNNKYCSDRKMDIEYLEKMENLLFEYYKKFETFMDEETKYIENSK